MPGKDSERADYQELIPLFHQLADESAPEPQRMRIRDLLVTGHLPVAEHIARKFRLINAVDRFDPTRGTDFLSFAVPTITGEVRRYFRDATWAVRVPRRLKELHAAITTASARLAQELGRSPRPKEIAAALGMPVEEVYEGLQVGFAYNTDSLDSGTDDDGHSPAENRLGDLDNALDLVEDREALIPALAKLPEREASIVVMRFFGNMTQTQIADRIGISQMHVSRLLSGSLEMLRAALSGNPREGDV